MVGLVKSDFKIQVGRRIERARKAMGMEPVAVYTALGVASGKYSQWENGWSQPRINEAIELVGLLHTSLDYIFRGIGAPHFRTIDESTPKPRRRTTRTKNVPDGSAPVSLRTVPK